MKRLKVTLIGGGTGLSVLARGLKHYPIDITAIVTVADDGGSTGIIRDQIDMPAPGDIRNVIGALSEEEERISELFNYRFKKDELDGHALGNLMIAAMYDMTGDFAVAVKELSNLLNVKGAVIPSTNVSPRLIARLKDGTTVEGESKIPENTGEIERVLLTPERIHATPEAIDALEQSDLIVFGPGSLYTSIIPNVLPEGMRKAIVCSEAAKVFVCNVMTQKGETIGYTCLDHIHALETHIGTRCIDSVILNTMEISDKISPYYLKNNSVPVTFDRSQLAQSNIEIHTSDALVEIDDSGAVRHNTEVLAELIYKIALSESSTIEYKKF